MARYGSGGEDFEAAAAELERMRKGREGLVARERAVQAEIASTSEAITSSTEKERVRRAAKRESAAVSERAAAVEGVEARAINVTTEAIQRQTRARERLNAANRQAAVNSSRALRGAQDPLFSSLQGNLAQPGVSQYALRNQLGVGQGRAQRIQEALRGGFRPSSGSESPLGPATRLQAAQLAHAQAELDAAAAGREATRARRATGTSPARLAELNAVRDSANAARQAAKLELESATKEAAARDENAAAAQREAARRSRPGTDIIRHPTEFGQPYYGAAYANPSLAARYGQPGVGAFPVSGRQLPTGPVAEGGPAHGGGRAAALNTEAAAASRAATAHRQYSDALRGDDLQRHIALNGQQATRMNQAAAATDKARVATRLQAVELSTASQHMRRHGALTSEFIAAAARGETTMRELGYQALATAGKFGGWTLAASAIYGAVGAVHQLGQGAIDSSSGVGQLQRVIQNVNGDQAQQDFSDLAGKFNVPVGEAADAVYRMGQVFHNQADATKAAEAALYSYKTGEVDVATSTQNLIAIVNGFGLSASDLSHVYDQINQAQNTFGIRIADTEQGLAKAAGTYRNAGGDLNYLLALFVAIQKATGRSGTEIGTGIARGVNEIRKPINQARLRAQGVDVDPENFQSTLQSALEAAKKPGADLQQIASGLFGNQYARLISPVLRDQDRLNAALRDTSPEASKGSAQKELAKVLGQVDEEITKVGVNLQRLGAALGRAGLGTIPYLFLKALNLSLDVAARLVETFDKLPGPIREAVSLFAQGALLLKLMRRFGTGDALAARFPQLGGLARPEEQARNLAVSGLRGQEKAATDYRENMNQRAFTQRANIEVAQGRLNQFDDQFRAQERAGNIPLGTERRDILLKQRAALQSALDHEVQIAENAKATALASRNLAQSAEREVQQIRGLKRHEVVPYLRANNYPLPASFDVPDARGADYIGGRRGQEALHPPAPTGRPADVLRHIDDVERAISPEMASAPGRLQRVTTRFSDRVRALGEGGSRLGYSGRVLTGAANVTAGAMDAGARGLSGAGRGLRGLAGGLKSILSGLGPLDAILLSFVALSELGNAIEERQAKIDANTRRRTRVPKTRGAYDRQTEELRQFSKLGGPTAGEVAQGFAEELNPINAFSGITGIGGYESPYQRRRHQQEIARQTYLTRQNIRERQEQQRARGGPVGQLLIGEVTARMDEDAKLRAQGVISLAEFDKRMKNHAIEIQTAYEPTAKETARAQERLKRVARQNANRGDFGRRFDGASREELTAEIQATQAELGQAGRTNNQFLFRELAAEYRRLIAQLSVSNDPKDRQALFQAQQQYAQTLEQASQATLDSDLLFARSEGTRRAAFRRYIRRAGNSAKAARDTLVQDQKHLADARATRGRDRAVDKATEGIPGFQFGANAAGVIGDSLGIPALGAGGRYFARLKRKLKKDNEDVARLAKQVKKDEQAYKDALQKQKEDRQKAVDTAFEDRQQGRDINLALNQSRTQNEGLKAKEAVDAARQALNDARRTYGVNSRQYRVALTNYNNAMTAQAQQLLANTEANNALITARASGDPGTAARAAVTTAQNTLNALKASGADPNKIKEANANLISAQIGLQNYQRDQANAIAGLRFDIAAARAEGDPVAQARIARQKAQYVIAHAKNQQERLQGLLDLANANNQMEQALRDREQARFEYLESLTDDPVKRAALERRAAHAALKGTKKGTAERYRALARENDAKRNETQAKVTAKEDDIDFELFMGRIDRQTAIERYQAILKQHGLTKAMRREIQRRIKGLQNEQESEASGFGLDMGSIKMPTIYDVRRAIGAGKQARGDARDRIISNMQNQVNVYVNDPNAADKVFEAIDTAMGTGIDMALKSAGMR